MASTETKASSSSSFADFDSTITINTVGVTGGITYLLFQKPVASALVDVNMFSTAWQKGTLGETGTAPTINVPMALGVAVSDSDQTGPGPRDGRITNALGGAPVEDKSIWSFALTSPGAAPTLTQDETKLANPKTIRIRNNKALTYCEAMLTKQVNGAPVEILRRRQVRVGDHIDISVHPSVFLYLQPPDSTQIGDDISSSETTDLCWEIPLTKSILNVLITEKSTSELVVTGDVLPVDTRSVFRRRALGPRPSLSVAKTITRTVTTTDGSRTTTTTETVTESIPFEETKETKSIPFESELKLPKSGKLMVWRQTLNVSYPGVYDAATKTFTFSDLKDAPSTSNVTSAYFDYNGVFTNFASVSKGRMANTWSVIEKT